uniref:Uncharacterized protein n=1 Tax=Lepeophtheirus salmonis TaxID=72036 RepID=A0A0K2UJU0_LEPSM
MFSYIVVIREYLNTLHENLSAVIKTKAIINYEYIFKRLTIIYYNFYQISKAITALEGKLLLRVSMFTIELL